MKRKKSHASESDLRQVKDLYETINSRELPDDSNSVQRRVVIVETLEDLLGTSFSDTRDMREKVSEFLGGVDFRRSPTSVRLRKARKKQGLTQRELARRLGYKNHVAISNFESGLRRPSKRIHQWLDEQGM